MNHSKRLITLAVLCLVAALAPKAFAVPLDPYRYQDTRLTVHPYDLQSRNSYYIDDSARQRAARRVYVRQINRNSVDEVHTIIHNNRHVVEYQHVINHDTYTRVPVRQYQPPRRQAVQRRSYTPVRQPVYRQPARPAYYRQPNYGYNYNQSTYSLPGGPGHAQVRFASHIPRAY